MALVITPSYLYDTQTYVGVPLRRAKLVVAGLSPGQINNVPHGLPNTPLAVALEPTSNNNFWESAAADASNIYVGVGSGAGTSTVIYMTY